MLENKLEIMASIKQTGGCNQIMKKCECSFGLEVCHDGLVKFLMSLSVWVIFNSFLLDYFTYNKHDVMFIPEMKYRHS